MDISIISIVSIFAIIAILIILGIIETNFHLISYPKSQLESMLMEQEVNQVLLGLLQLALEKEE